MESENHRVSSKKAGKKIPKKTAHCTVQATEKRHENEPKETQSYAGEKKTSKNVGNGKHQTVCP